MVRGVRVRDGIHLFLSLSLYIYLYLRAYVHGYPQHTHARMSTHCTYTAKAAATAVTSLYEMSNKGKNYRSRSTTTTTSYASVPDEYSPTATYARLAALTDVDTCNVRGRQLYAFYKHYPYINTVTPVDPNAYKAGPMLSMLDVASTVIEENKEEIELKVRVLSLYVCMYEYVCVYGWWVGGLVDWLVG